MSFACNHLFYHPSRQMLMDPSRVDIQYTQNWIKGEQGVRLASWWLKPEPARRLGRIILHLHGNAENMSSHFLFVAWLVQEGYDVITFDYRSYGLSSPEPPTQKGLVDDTCSVLRWIEQQPDFQHLPRFVIAQSLGGAMILPSLQRCPPSALLKAVVIDSSFASYRGIARAKLGSIWLTWALQYPLSWLVSDIESPKQAAASFDRPLLFFHSPDDPVVPYMCGRELYEEARAPKEFIDVSIPGHTTALARDGSPYRQVLLDFLDISARR